jgi:hypothetical protein
MKKTMIAMACAIGGMSAVLLAAPALAADALRVQVPAQYVENASVMGRIRSECQLEDMLGKQVFEAVQKRYPDVSQVADPSQLQTGRVLKLNILTVEGVGGGGWSGSKAITARAELMQDGVVIQSAVRRDRSRGGLWGPARGTCSILESVGESLGNQFADWLVYAERTAPAAPAPAPPVPPPAVSAPVAEPAAEPVAEPVAGTPSSVPAGDNPRSAP